MTPKPIYSQLATMLRAERRQKSLSRQKVASQLHVPEATITALENPSGSTIPDSHLPGLYRRYAELLQFENEEIDKLIAKIQTGRSEANRRVKPLKRIVIVSSTVQRLVVSFIIASISLYAAWQFGILFSKPALSIDSISEYTVVTEPELDIQGSSYKNSTVFLNGEPIEADEQGRFSQRVYLQPGYNSLEFSTSNNFGRTTSLNRVIILQTD